MRSVVVSLFMAAASGIAGAADGVSPSTVDLSALLDEVERASPQLLATRARAESADNAALQREALPDPKLSAAYTNDGLSSFTLGDSEFANLALSWEQEVPSRAARAGSASVAQAEAEALRTSTASVKARLRARVITLFAELWRLDGTKALLAESRGLLASSAEAVRARYESGDAIQESWLRAQAATRALELELEAVRLARRQVELALAETLGRTEDPSFGPAAALPELAGSLDDDALAAAAVTASPDVLERASLERVAQARVDEARVQTKPVFSWVAGYQYRGSLDPMVSGGFSVRLPVRKDRNQARGIAGAELSRTAAGYDRVQSEIVARSGARGLVGEIASIDVRLRLYREAIVPQAEAAFESANAAFSSGRAEMFLVLDDLDRWVGARKETLTWSARRIEAIAALEAMTGIKLFQDSTLGRSQ
jgi:outer membrane protein TolC